MEFMAKDLVVDLAQEVIDLRRDNDDYKRRLERKREAAERVLKYLKSGTVYVDNAIEELEDALRYW